MEIKFFKFLLYHHFAADADHVFYVEFQIVLALIAAA